MSHPATILLTGVVLGFALAYYWPDGWWPSGPATPAAPVAAK
jgi:hypothetical protein